MKTWGEDVEGFSQHLYISKKVQYLFLKVSKAHFIVTTVIVALVF